MISLPETEKPADGAFFFKVSSLTEKDSLAVIFALPPKDQLAEGWFVVSVSQQGMVKKSAADEIPGPAAAPFTLVRINDGDELGWLRLSDGKSDIFLAAASGMAIRFSEEDVRPMGLVAAGVMGIKLEEGDTIIGADLFPQRGELFLLASNGRAKRVLPDDFPTQGRYGKGVIAWKLPKGVRLLGCSVGTKTKPLTLHLKKFAAKMISLGDAPVQTRAATRGSVIYEIRSGDEIIAVTVPEELIRPLKKE